MCIRDSINDDIGFLSEMPGQYARVAKRKINKQVYEVIVKNPAVYRVPDK